MNDKHVQSQFKPNLLHPFYFIRKGLYKVISKKSVVIKGKLLDFGCGDKPYKALFDVDEYIGVDYFGEGHLHNKKEEIDFFYNGVNLPFKDSFFDSVISIEVFEHIFNLESIIPEIRRVMKPQAKLLITCPFVWNEHELPADYARYTKYGLIHLLNKNGFKLISFEKKGNFIETLFQLIILYFNPYLLKIPIFGFFISKVYCLVINLFGIFFSFLSHKRFDLYLSNVILVEKV